MTTIQVLKIIDEGFTQALRAAVGYALMGEVSISLFWLTIATQWLRLDDVWSGTYYG